MEQIESPEFQRRALSPSPIIFGAPKKNGLHIESVWLIVLDLSLLTYLKLGRFSRGN